MILERTTVHVSDDTGRIAMVETRTQGTDDSSQQLQRYIYSDHLGSSTLELDENAKTISYEEYHPYGTTAWQESNADINAVAKRYRFTGKERDEESGLYYHGARYYIPWLCRWSAVDPKESERAGLSPYDYCSNNPINRTDPDGMKDNEHEVSTFTVKDKAYVGTTLTDEQLLIPKGYEVATDTEAGSNGTRGVAHVLAIRDTSGNTYSWNEKKHWYTNAKGKSYSNPGVAGLAMDITNRMRSNVQHSVGQAAKDWIEHGDPSKSLKDSYASFVKHDGKGGVAGYTFVLGAKAVWGLARTVNQATGSGHDAVNARIDIWQLGASMGAPVDLPNIKNTANLAAKTANLAARNTKLLLNRIGFKPINIGEMNIGINYLAEHGLTGRTLLHFENKKVGFRLDYHNLPTSKNPIPDNFLHYHYTNKKLPVGTPNNSMGRHLQIGTGINITNSTQLKTTLGIKH